MFNILIARSSSAMTSPTGTVNGNRRSGRQKNRWEGSVKVCTWMDFASTSVALDDRTKRKGIVETSMMRKRNCKVMGYFRLN